MSYLDSWPIRSRILDDLPGRHLQLSTRTPRDNRVVGDQKDRPATARKLGEQIQDGLGGCRIEVAGRLVGQEEIGSQDERTRNRLSGQAAMSSPSSWQNPLSGRSRHPSTFSSVDLPHPEGPEMATKSPEGTCTSKPHNA
jgi:hypothetical protein